MSERDPFEPKFTDGPFGSAEETRRAWEQAEDDLDFERLSDGGPDVQEYLRRKHLEVRREFQERELRQVEREEVARASHAGSLATMAVVLVRAAIDGKSGPTYRQRLAVLLGLDGGPEAFARVVLILLRSYVAETRSRRSSSSGSSTRSSSRRSATRTRARDGLPRLWNRARPADARSSTAVLLSGLPGASAPRPPAAHFVTIRPGGHADPSQAARAAPSPRVRHVRGPRRVA